MHGDTNDRNCTLEVSCRVILFGCGEGFGKEKNRTFDAVRVKLVDHYSKTPFVTTVHMKTNRDRECVQCIVILVILIPGGGISLSSGSVFNVWSPSRSMSSGNCHKFDSFNVMPAYPVWCWRRYCSQSLTISFRTRHSYLNWRRNPSSRIQMAYLLFPAC